MAERRLRLDLGTAAELIECFDEEVSVGGIFLAGATTEPVMGLEPCVVEICVAGEHLLDVVGEIGAVSAAGVAVLLPDVPPGLVAVVEQLRAAPPPGIADLLEPEPEPEPEPESDSATEARGTTQQRLAALSPNQKIQLALSGTREERLALIRDTNKTVHQYVLRNPRTTLDEVQYIAKQTSLSPDALSIIANHPEWGHDQTVCAALVRNPKTPSALAIRALDRLSMNDLRTVARGGGRPMIVQAARKKLNL